MYLCVNQWFVTRQPIVVIMAASHWEIEYGNPGHPDSPASHEIY